jgi:hypothetical protein
MNEARIISTTGQLKPLPMASHLHFFAIFQPTSNKHARGEDPGRTIGNKIIHRTGNELQNGILFMSQKNKP